MDRRGGAHRLTVAVNFQQRWVMYKMRSLWSSQCKKNCKNFRTSPMAAALGWVSRKTHVHPCQRLKDPWSRGQRRIMKFPHRWPTKQLCGISFVPGLPWSLGSQERAGHGPYLWEARILQSDRWATDQGPKIKGDSVLMPTARLWGGVGLWQVWQDTVWDASHVL